MIHLRPIHKPRLKADTRALRNVKIETTRKLEMEVRATAREPRHFKDSEHFRQTGEMA